MPETPPSPVKIYDRPERTGPSPVVLIVILLVVLIAGYFLYRAFVHPAAPQQHSQAGTIRVQAAFLQEVNVHGKWQILTRYR